LQWVLANPKSLSIDPSKILLAGSSAGANLTAAVASMARDAKISGLSGVVLNVPVLCHPDHFPQEKYELRSYEQCTGTLLHSVEMRQCWDLYVPDEKETGASPLVSLLLSDHRGLPPTHIFVAGQYPVRDEGIAYAEALQAAGVHAKLSVYGGVPHTLAEFDELETTGSFIRILWLV